MFGNFDVCFTETLKWEGGDRYTNTPHDPGGPTKYGIDLSTLSQEMGGHVTALDVQNLTYTMASEIAKKRYWNCIKGDSLPSGVDMMAFDIAFNMGVGRVLPWLKVAPGTTAVDWIQTLHVKRMSFWRALKTWAYFHAGWSNRENDVLAQALALAKKRASA